jgi:aminopeptidase
MADPRIARWGDVLARYSLGLQPGHTLNIQAPPVAAPLVREVYRAALRLGAHPVVQLTLPELTEIFFQEASEAQLQWVAPQETLVLEQFNATLSILGQENTRALTGVDPQKQSLFSKGRQSLNQIFARRNADDSLNWSVTLWPTNAYAQDAEMSLADFTEFVFSACLLNHDDPVAQWQALGREQQRLVDWMQGKHQVHVRAPGTDLRVGIGGRSFINGDGKRNFPDGEFFTGPVEDEVDGEIAFTLPAIYGGRAVEGVRLRFAQGQVVEATATQGQAFLDRMLATDEGARRLGEFAFGNNFGVTRGSKNILFDEKLGGSIHMALGQTYPQTGGKNTSAIHWDMICDLRQGGEVTVDGQLFMKDGKFVV